MPDFLYFSAIPAFILGFSLARASTCSIAATRRLVIDKKPDWLVGLALAASWSALTMLALAYFNTGSLNTPQHYHIGHALIIGAAVMGLGAWLNDACFIGSVGKISSGNLSYLLTFAGLATGLWVSKFPQYLPLTPDNTEVPPPGQTVSIILMCIFAGFVLFGIWSIIKHRKEAIIALTAMGITAATTYSIRPDWTYESMLDRFIRTGATSANYVVEVTVIALFIGAILSSIRMNRFALTVSPIWPSTQNFIGGILMGLGAKLVHAGNDTTLLWFIPGEAIHGFVAFGVMIVSVALLMLAKRAVVRV